MLLTNYDRAVYFFLRVSCATKTIEARLSTLQTRQRNFGIWTLRDSSDTVTMSHYRRKSQSSRIKCLFNSSTLTCFTSLFFIQLQSASVTARLSQSTTQLFYQQLGLTDDKEGICLKRINRPPDLDVSQIRKLKRHQFLC